jgi:hypothetical protein
MEESKKEEHEKRAEIRAQRVSETAQAFLKWRSLPAESVPNVSLESKFL